MFLYSMGGDWKLPIMKLAVPAHEPKDCSDYDNYIFMNILPRE